MLLLLFANYSQWLQLWQETGGDRADPVGALSLWNVWGQQVTVSTPSRDEAPGKWTHHTQRARAKRQLQPESSQRIIWGGGKGRETLSTHDSPEPLLCHHTGPSSPLPLPPQP